MGGTIFSSIVYQMHVVLAGASTAKSARVMALFLMSLHGARLEMINAS
jgi:hypothetical protein